MGRSFIWILHDVFFLFFLDFFIFLRSVEESESDEDELLSEDEEDEELLPEDDDEEDDDDEEEEEDDDEEDEESLSEDESPLDELLSSDFFDFVRAAVWARRSSFFWCSSFLACLAISLVLESLWTYFLLPVHW